MVRPLLPEDFPIVAVKSEKKNEHSDSFPKTAGSVYPQKRDSGRKRALIQDLTSFFSIDRYPFY